MPDRVGDRPGGARDTDLADALDAKRVDVTEYGSGEWVSRSQKRKAKRDEARERFWEEAGVDRASAVSDISFAPRDQRVNVVRLMQATRDGQIDGVLNDFLPLVARSLHATGLGLGPMGAVAENLTDLTRFHTQVLEHFFEHAYKFEGPRES